MKKIIIQEIENFFDILWPLNRSLTGNDVRKTHKILSKIIPLKTYEIRSGTKIGDWKVPYEWNVNYAFLKDKNGKTILDFKNNNLHLLGYSSSIKKEIKKKDLIKHLYYIKRMPSAVPYKTSYYKKKWGFCLSFNDYQKLNSDFYNVDINTNFKKGSMTMSEFYLPGKVKKEILIHTYTCHPSMAINELSGPLVAAFLAREIKKEKNRHFSYRFVFAPETIGAIAFLSKKGGYLKKNLLAGYICTCVGHKSQITYKESKIGVSVADLAAKKVLSKIKYLKKKFLKFSPSGSDERQYCSIGYNLPVGSLMRIPYGKYKEYHTSLDNKKIINFNSMYETILIYKKIFNLLEKNYYNLDLKNKNTKILKKNIKKKYPFILVTKGEPFLTKHKVNYSTKDHANADTLTLATKWLVHFCDGYNSLNFISKKSKIKVSILKKSLKELNKRGLIRYK
jgi:aminopeptidase-like protein